MAGTTALTARMGDPGESAQKNEMCILNGVYYPTPDDGSSLTQNLP